MFTYFNDLFVLCFWKVARSLIFFYTTVYID